MTQWSVTLNINRGTCSQKFECERQTRIFTSFQTDKSITMSKSTNLDNVEPIFSAANGAIDMESNNQNSEQWKASKQIKMILGCLSVVSLVVAIDATILVSALP